MVVRTSRRIAFLCEADANIFAQIYTKYFPRPFQRLFPFSRASPPPRTTCPPSRPTRPLPRPSVTSPRPHVTWVTSSSAGGRSFCCGRGTSRWRHCSAWHTSSSTKVSCEHPTLGQRRVFVIVFVTIVAFFLLGQSNLSHFLDNIRLLLLLSCLILLVWPISIT